MFPLRGTGTPTPRHRNAFLLLLIPWCLSAGCREEVPSNGSDSPIIRFTLRRGDHHIFSNWLRDPDGRRILHSRYRSAWRVLDTSGVFGGYTDVIVVEESTFAVDRLGRDSLASVESRMFRTNPDGAFLEFGYLSRLLDERDTVTVPSTWDTLFAPAATWVVQASDSARRYTAYPQQQREFAETNLDGIPTVLITTLVHLEGPNMFLQFWVADSPPAILRFRDASPVRNNRRFSELSALTTGN